MTTFLTSPIWYNKTGNLIQLFDNTTYKYNNGEINNIAIGRDANSGADSGVMFGGIAIGEEAKSKANGAIAIGSRDGDGGTFTVANGVGSIVIGSGAQANVMGNEKDNGIAIGSGALSYQGGIAIGGDAFAGENQIQLGDPSIEYTLTIGKKGYIPGLFDFGSLPKYESSGTTVSSKMTINNLTTGFYIAYYRLILRDAGNNDYDFRDYKFFTITNAQDVGNYNLPNMVSYGSTFVNASLTYSESAQVNVNLIVNGDSVKINCDKMSYLQYANSVTFQAYKLSY